MSKKKKMFDVSLNNLTAKPSDFLPGRYEQLTIDDLTKRKSDLDLDYYIREFDTFRNSLNAKLGSLHYYMLRRADPVTRDLYGCLRDIEVMSACLMCAMQEVIKKGGLDD